MGKSARRKKVPVRLAALALPRRIATADVAKGCIMQHAARPRPLAPPAHPPAHAGGAPLAGGGARGTLRSAHSPTGPIEQKYPSPMSAYHRTGAAASPPIPQYGAGSRMWRRRSHPRITREGGGVHWPRSAPGRTRGGGFNAVVIAPPSTAPPRMRLTAVSTPFLAVGQPCTRAPSCARSSPSCDGGGRGRRSEGQACRVWAPPLSRPR